MSVRLVRESSLTPNIANKDDARMVRYAYGGYDGIVKSYGQELLYNYVNGIFTVGSGRVVLQGWEVDIDASGWALNLQSVTGTRYYTIYLEVNLVTEKAELKSQYATSAYPYIETGDDLTNAPNGIANLVLYQFKLVNGAIASIETKVQKINYVKDVAETLTQRVTDLENGTTSAKIAEYASSDYSKGTIEERLTKLGFKSGQVTPSSSVSLTQNEIKKLGTMVYGRYVQPFDRNAAYAIGETVFTVPEGFRPYSDTEVYGYGVLFNEFDPVSIKLTIKTDGTAIISGLESGVPVTYAASFNIVYGYMTVNPDIYM